MNRLAIILAIVLLVADAFAQELPSKAQQQLEGLAEATEAEEQKDDSYLQQLVYYKKHPLDLSTATTSDMQAIGFLTDLQIDHFIAYRNVLGKLIDVYELQAIPAWDLATIHKLLPYIKLGAATSVREKLISRFKGGEPTLMLRISRALEKSRGYDASLSNHYLGDRNHLLLRYRYQYKNLLQYGLVADKDAGEQFFKGGQSQGFDFYSAHFFVRGLGKIKALAIGDYTVNLGQGLIQWQSLGFGKSTEVMGIKRQSPVLLPYRSAGEFNFNRGVGTTIQFNRIEATAFVSYKKFSGNVVDTLDAFSSFLTSGLHRTPAELAGKNAITDFSIGGQVGYRGANLKIGVNAIRHQFSKVLQKRDEPYNRFTFNGNQLLNTGFDYSYTYKNLHLFGEVALDKSLNRAMVHGALISVDTKVDVAVLYRQLPKEYQTIFGNAQTENTLPVNEEGIYAGIGLRPFSRWQVNAYADIFKFPWLRYRVDAPSAGSDYLFQVNYQPNKQAEIYMLYRNKNKPLNTTSGTTDFPLDQRRQSVRLHFSTPLSPAVAVKGRVEMLWYSVQDKGNEEGFLCFLDGSYKRRKLHSSLRLQYFEAGSYNSRIYAFENDVLYSSSVPAFFNKGFRYYINLNYDISKHLGCWLRWSQTLYKNLDQFGSGLDETNGPVQSRITLQLEVGL